MNTLLILIEAIILISSTLLFSCYFSLSNFFSFLFSPCSLVFCFALFSQISRLLILIIHTLLLLFLFISQIMISLSFSHTERRKSIKRSEVRQMPALPRGGRDELAREEQVSSRRVSRSWLPTLDHMTGNDHRQCWAWRNLGHHKAWVCGQVSPTQRHWHDLVVSEHIQQYSVCHIMWVTWEYSHDTDEFLKCLAVE